MKKRGSGRHTVRKNLRKLFTGVILIFTICISFGAFLVSAHEKSGNQNVYTYYKSIEIQPGDTLWEIAENTMPDEHGSVAEYVQQLKDMNNLSSDKIYSGQNLIISYNDTDYKS